MADPLSVATSVQPLVTAALQAAKSLSGAIKRCKNRGSALARLQRGLEELVTALVTLEAVAKLDAPILPLLRDPVIHCNQLCRDFERAMDKFAGKSKAGLIDWSKMQFMRGDVNDFMDALDVHKSTISVGLAVITMQTSSVTFGVFEEITELIQDTTQDLQICREQLEEKIAAFRKAGGASVDVTELNDELAATRQCIRVCEDAWAYLDLVQRQGPIFQEQADEDATAADLKAHALTQRLIDDHRDTLAESIGRLRQRLEALSTDREDERQQLRRDIETSRQSLEVCKAASRKAADKRIYVVGEAVSDSHSDQVLVNTLTGLFDVKRAAATNNSMQLLGFMSEAALEKLSAERYGSRYGGARAASVDVQADVESTISSPRMMANCRALPDLERVEQWVGGRKPLPNEVQKRTNYM